MMTVLVCGGRDYADREKVDGKLSLILGRRDRSLLRIVTGDAKGADQLAQDWAERHGVRCTMYIAEWGKHGRAAGPMRNKRMLDETKPDLVLAFPGGAGTADMVRQARAAGVLVREVAR